MARILRIKYGLILILHCFNFTATHAQCSQDANGVYRYGPGCAFMCHCLTSEQCDVNTGECQSGCDFDWVGPGCQYKNLAVGQLPRHIDNLPQYQFAHRANDRSVSTCSYTGDENTTRSRNPWWKVWLPYNFTLRQMEILTINSHRRFFDRFNVIVEYVPENEKENRYYFPDQSQICYTHKDSTLENMSETVTCDKYFTGNQVRIQLSSKTTQLVLCDVRIYGEGSVGYKILASNNTADFHFVHSIDGNSQTAINSSVNFISSSIKITQTQKRLAICEVQVIGDCLENYCGYNCNKVCHCKNITATDKLTGICSNGCTGRWSGDGGACDIQCNNSNWGETCQNQCGQCRDTEPCNVVTGKCPARCEDGYKKTDLCDIACTGGYYGYRCLQKCSKNCVGGYSHCDHVYGSCMSGCTAGWRGRKCDEECDDGRWGENCDRTCLNCNNHTCDRFSGSCKEKCKPGFRQTKYCDQECSSGWYGINCSRQCNPNCKDVTFCRKMDGSCSECKSGFEGILCEKAAIMHISGGGLAGIVLTGITLMFITAIATVFATRRMRHTKMKRSQNTFENEAVSYSNSLAESTFVTLHTTQDLNQTENIDNIYDTIKRKSGNEHTYE